MHSQVRIKKYLEKQENKNQEERPGGERKKNVKTH